MTLGAAQQPYAQSHRDPARLMTESASQLGLADPVKETQRIHMLYKGKMQNDVEKERNLTMYQLKVAKQSAQKHSNGITDFKLQNAELKTRIKRYVGLVEE